MTTQAKEIIESLVTSSLSAEEILKQLDSYGIEWYLSEKGDLTIKYWQVGAEDFMPPEHVATIREDQPVPPEADMLEWLSRHLRDLQVNYPGQWIAVMDNQVVAASDNLQNLLQRLGETGIECPFVTQIPPGPVVWTTTYAR